MLIGDFDLPRVQDTTLGFVETAEPFSDLIQSSYSYDVQKFTWVKKSETSASEIWVGLWLTPDLSALRRYMSRVLVFAQDGAEGYKRYYDSFHITQLATGSLLGRAGASGNGSFQMFPMAPLETTLQPQQNGQYQRFLDHQNDILYGRINSRTSADSQAESLNAL